MGNTDIKKMKNLVKRLEESGLSGIKVKGDGLKYIQEVKCITLGGRELIYERDKIPEDIQHIFKDNPELFDIKLPYRQNEKTN